LHKDNAINFKLLFYKELTTTIIIKKIRAIKLLVAIDQNINKLFFNL